VVDGDWGPSSPSPKRGQSPQIFGPCLLWPNGWMDQDALGMEVGLGPGHIVLDGNQDPPERGHSPQFSAHVCCGQTAVCIMIPLSMEVGLTLGDIVLDRVAACPYKGHSPQFSAHVYCGRGCPSQLLLASCLSSKSRSSEINLHFVIRWRCRVIRWWKLAEKRLGRREARCCACIVRLNLC